MFLLLVWYNTKMGFIIFWIIVICAIILFFKKHKKIQVVVHHVPVIEKKAIVGYKKKFRIMNGSESALFFELRKQLPQSYYVFPNMRIADVVDVINGQGFYKRQTKSYRDMWILLFATKILNRLLL